MNKQLRAFAESTLKEGLAKCTEGQQDVFKRMYAHGTLLMPINDVVDALPDEKIDWAMQIAWSYADLFYHSWPVKCGATVYSIGVLKNLAKGIKKPCSKCFQLELGL